MAITEKKKLKLKIEIEAGKLSRATIGKSLQSGNSSVKRDGNIKNTLQNFQKPSRKKQLPT